MKEWMRLLIHSFLSLRNFFLTTLLDTDAADFTEIYGKIIKKEALSVLSVKSVYKKRMT